MISLLYSGSDAVRSVLGVTIEEWSDESMQASPACLDLPLALAIWLPDHAARWDAYDGPSPTASQIKVGQALQQWCTYYAAWLMTPSLPLIVQQSLQDSKTTYVRKFTSQDVAQLRASTSEMAASYRALIEAEVALSLPDPTLDLLPPGLKLSPLSPDPVTDKVGPPAV